MSTNGKMLNTTPEIKLAVRERTARAMMAEMIRRMSLDTHMPLGDVYLGGGRSIVR